jgi:hypothetical protein
MISTVLTGNQPDFDLILHCIQSKIKLYFYMLSGCFPVEKVLTRLQHFLPENNRITTGFDRISCQIPVNDSCDATRFRLY